MPTKVPKTRRESPLNGLNEYVSINTVINDEEGIKKVGSLQVAKRERISSSDFDFEKLLADRMVAP